MPVKKILFSGSEIRSANSGKNRKPDTATYNRFAAKCYLKRYRVIEATRLAEIVPINRINMRFRDYSTRSNHIDTRVGFKRIDKVNCPIGMIYQVIVGKQHIVGCGEVEQMISVRGQAFVIIKVNSHIVSTIKCRDIKIESVGVLARHDILHPVDSGEVRRIETFHPASERRYQYLQPHYGHTHSLSGCLGNNK